MSAIQSAINCGDLRLLSSSIVSAAVMTTYGFSGNFTYRLSGEDNTFVFLKIALHALDSYYQWAPPPRNLRESVDAEIAMMRAIRKELILRNVTPHFVEILAQSTCEDVSRFITDPEECMRQRMGHVHEVPGNIGSLMCAFSDLVKMGIAQNKFSIIFSSFCNMGLREMITNHAPIGISDQVTEIYSIIFQVYYTLLCARRVWPGFRHGDLSTNNVMIEVDMQYKRSQSSAQQFYSEYIIDSRKWYIPYRGYTLKIIDFGHGEIPDIDIKNALRMPMQGWIPDHIYFIVSFEELVRALPSHRHIAFNLFNPNKVGYNSRDGMPSFSILYELASTFPDPETIFRDTTVFDQFLSAKMQSKYIRHSYSAPKAY